MLWKRRKIKHHHHHINNVALYAMTYILGIFLKLKSL